MTKYKLLFDRKYIKELKKIPTNFQSVIKEKVNDLSENPRPNGFKKLQVSKKESIYRIRVGDYRVVYTIKDSMLVVLIIEVGHRKDIYL